MPISRRAVRILASTSLALAVCVPAAASLPSESPGGAETVSASMASVSADSAGDVWAVGSQQRGAQPVRALVLHGDGSSWSRVEAVNPSKVNTTLNAVKALAPDDVWTVGSYDQDGVKVALAEHWDGSTWTTVDTVPGKDQHAEFLAVDAAGPNDVWAVGRTTACGICSLVEHWDGTRWTAYTMPIEWDTLYLTGVVAQSATSAWAVGYLTDDEGTVFATSYRWDGTSWHLVNLRWHLCDGFDDFCGLRGVDATPAGDIWAAGDGDTWDPPELPRIGHHIHRAWKNVHARSHRIGAGTFLRSVSAVAKDDVWIIGDYDNGPSYRVYMLHWDGSKWSQVYAPSPGGTAPKTGASISAVASDDVYAVGSWGNVGSSRPYVEHWDGADWSVVLKGLPS